MRILIVEDFDPAGVLLGHRDLLRGAGMDARVALGCAYTARHLDADWICDGSSEQGRAEVRDFASRADLVVWAPAIGQPWADDPSTDALGLHLEPPGSPWGPLRAPQARQVAYFHGSSLLWAQRARYAAHYRGLGWELATSTLDYAEEMGAAYLPPVAPEPTWTARPREDGEPLVVAHTPTNPEICGTEALVRCARACAVPVLFGHRIEHDSALWLKAEANAGFDHLRGSFSVNHLENCVAGLASLVGLKPQYAERLASEGFPLLPTAVEDERGLRETLRDLAASAELTRAQQRACREWVQAGFAPDAIRARLLRFAAIRP